MTTIGHEVERYADVEHQLGVVFVVQVEVADYSLLPDQRPSVAHGLDETEDSPFGQSIPNYAPILVADDPCLIDPQFNDVVLLGQVPEQVDDQPYPEQEQAQQGYWEREPLGLD